MSLRYDLHGNYKNDIRFTAEEAKNIIVIHPVVRYSVGNLNITQPVSFKDIKKASLSFYRWTDNGMTTFKNRDDGRQQIEIKDLDFLVEEGIPHFLEALAEVIRHARSGSYICSSCEKSIKSSHLRHFAGIYCEPCWKAYQKAHSGTCSRCHRPYYECCC